MTTSEAAATGSGITVILAGAAELANKLSEALADGQLSISEASSLFAIAMGVLAVLRLRRAIGHK